MDNIFINFAMLCSLEISLLIPFKWGWLFENTGFSLALHRQWELVTEIKIRLGIKSIKSFITLKFPWNSQIECFQMKLSEVAQVSICLCHWTDAADESQARKQLNASTAGWRKESLNPDGFPASGWRVHRIGPLLVPTLKGDESLYINH